MAAEDPLTPAQQLARLLEEHRMLRRDLAKKLAKRRGIAESTARSSVYKWLRGSHVPDEVNAMALGKIFRVESTLFRGRNDDNGDGDLLILEQLEEIRRAIETRDRAAQALTAQMRDLLTEIALQIERQSALLEELAARVGDLPGASKRPGRGRRNSQ